MGRKDFKKLLAVVLSIVMMFGGVVVNPVTTEAKTKKYVKKLSVSKTDLEISEGESVKISYNVTVLKGASKKISIKISDKKVISARIVGKKIVIKGKKPGNSILTVVTNGKKKNGKKIAKKISVRVLEEEYNYDDDDSDSQVDTKKDSSTESKTENTTETTKEPATDAKSDKTVDSKPDSSHESKNNQVIDSKEPESLPSSNEDPSTDKENEPSTNSPVENPTEDKNESSTEEKIEKPDSTLQIVGSQKPTLVYEGEEFSLSGTIKSNYMIIQIVGKIESLDAKGNATVVYKKEVSPNNYEYMLANSDIDKALTFKNLKTASTKYRYTLYAQDSYGKSISYGSDFEVQKGCKLAISSYNYPSTITKGEDYKLSATITSAYKIKYLYASILSSDKKSTLQKAKYERPDVQTVTQYDFGNDFNNQLDFSKLAAGTYYYRIEAYDINPNTKYNYAVLLEKSFTVKAPANSCKIKLSNYNYPTEIVQGNDFKVEATLTSDYKFKYINVYIYSGTDNVLQKAYYARPDVQTVTQYDFGKDFNDQLDFSKLSPGTYGYKITAFDINPDSDYDHATLLDKKFTVKASSSLSKTLSINWSDIQKVGKQIDGKQACACYSLAYCRTILSGTPFYWYQYNANGGRDEGTASCNWAYGNYGCHYERTKAEIFKIAYDCINNNEPMIVHVTQPNGGQHWVAVVGYQNVTSISNMTEANLLILDPLMLQGYKVVSLSSRYKLREVTEGDGKAYRYVTRNK